MLDGKSFNYKIYNILQNIILYITIEYIFKNINLNNKFKNNKIIYKIINYIKNKD